VFDFNGIYMSLPHVVPGTIHEKWLPTASQQTLYKLRILRAIFSRPTTIAHGVPLYNRLAVASSRLRRFRLSIEPPCTGGLTGYFAAFLGGNALPAGLTALEAALTSERDGSRVFAVIGLRWLYIFADGDL
jgi:hypothetical protein